ncbi:MAG: tRNA (N6-isopentenyl adenosine(37)-C2)-methylthiotransferase MiaB [Bacteroidales bacterium]|nr:tRNA (N6-isopentenyl adenosine(37)-C2)-methylthiotransferase MiaB [Bacteroidales bacterium]
MKYHLVTLGCQMNISDSGRVKTYIENLGYESTDNPHEADLLGVIACSVRQKAIDKVYNLIAVWNRQKGSRPFSTFLTGCILPDDREKFLKSFDMVFDMRDLTNFADMLAKHTHEGTYYPKLSREEQAYQMDYFWKLEGRQPDKFEAFVPIQNGCDKFCTYCAVPYTRGREVSRSSSEIVEEVKCLVNAGFKSITLLGQNVNSYGLDKKGKEISFAQLLDLIGRYGDESGKEFYVYFTSPHPRDMTDDVLETIAKYKCLGKWIHIPIQSGDTEMLKRMNRKYDIERYRSVIHSIRTILPTATIFTDIIVGFTGETLEEFENTRRAVLEFKYNMAFIAMYSPRPGAKSSQWVDDVPKDEKSRRYAVLSEDLKSVSSLYTASMVGKEFRILVNGHDRLDGYLSGLTEGKIAVRFKSENEALIGSFVNVKITKSSDFSAEGEMIYC